jgi:hypothetical protein
MCAFCLVFCFSPVIPGLSVFCSLYHAGFPTAFFLFFCVSCVIRICGFPCFSLPLWMFEDMPFFF